MNIKYNGFNNYVKGGRRHGLFASGENMKKLLIAVGIIGFLSGCSVIPKERLQSYSFDQLIDRFPGKDVSPASFNNPKLPYRVRVEDLYRSDEIPDSKLLHISESTNFKTWCEAHDGYVLAVAGTTRVGCYSQSNSPNVYLGGYEYEKISGSKRRINYFFYNQESVVKANEGGKK